MITQIVGCVETLVKYRPPASQRRDVAGRISRSESRQAAVSSYNLGFRFITSFKFSHHRQAPAILDTLPVEVMPVCPATEQYAGGVDRPSGSRSTRFFLFLLLKVCNFEQLRHCESLSIFSSTVIAFRGR